MCASVPGLFLEQMLPPTFILLVATCSLPPVWELDRFLVHSGLPQSEGKSEDLGLGSHRSPVAAVTGSFLYPVDSIQDVYEHNFFFFRIIFNLLLRPHLVVPGAATSIVLGNVR